MGDKSLLRDVIQARISTTMGTGPTGAEMSNEARASVDYVLGKMTELHALDEDDVDTLSAGIGIVMAAEMLVSIEHGMLDQLKGRRGVVTAEDIVKWFTRMAMGALNGQLAGILDRADRLGE